MYMLYIFKDYHFGELVESKRRFLVCDWSTLELRGPSLRWYDIEDCPISRVSSKFQDSGNTKITFDSIDDFKKWFVKKYFVDLL